jgi:hypothetical protein
MMAQHAISLLHPTAKAIMRERRKPDDRIQEDEHAVSVSLLRDDAGDISSPLRDPKDNPILAPNSFRGCISLQISHYRRL